MQPIFSLEANLENICYPDDFQGVEENDYTTLISILIEKDSTLEQIEEDFIIAAKSGDSSCPRAIALQQIEKAIAVELRDLDLNWYFADEDKEGSYYQAYMTLTWDYDSCLEYSIPEFLLSAIVNDDVTGITDEDEKCLDKFLASAEAQAKSTYPKCNHTSWVFGEQTNFDTNHDVDGIGHSDCVSAKLVVHL